MTKLTLNDVTNLNNQSSSVGTINDNSDKVVAAIENTLSRDGAEPNDMESTLDMNSNRVINLVKAVLDTEPIRKKEFDEAVFGELQPENPFDPFEVDFEVKSYTTLLVDLVNPVPLEMSDIPINLGDWVLFNHSSSAILNGIWEAAQPDPDVAELFWARPAAYTGFINKKLRVRVNTQGEEDIQLIDGNVYEMSQAFVNVDVTATTWFILTVSSGTVPAGTFLAGPSTPSSANAAYANRRMVTHDLPRRLGGQDLTKQIPIFNYLRQMHLLSDYFDTASSYDGKLQLTRALNELDEVVIDRRCLRFTSALDLKSWSKKRIISASGKGRDGPVTIYTLFPTDGGLIFSTPDWTMDGQFNIVARLQTVAGVHGIQIQSGAKDIIFTEGVDVQGFDNNILIDGAGTGSAGLTGGVDGVELGSYSCRSPGNYNLRLSSDTTNKVTNVRVKSIIADAATSVVLSVVPTNVRVSTNVGTADRQGVVIERGELTGGLNGIIHTMTTISSSLGISETNRPRNNEFRHVNIHGATSDGIVLNAGSDVRLIHCKSRANSGNGLILNSHFQGHFKAEMCNFDDNVMNGVYDLSTFALEKTFDACAASGNSASVANTYSGFKAGPQANNLKLIRCRSGVSSSNTYAESWMRIVTQPNDGDTFTIDGQVMTFKAVPVGVTDILIGVDKAATLVNWINFLNTTVNATFLQYVYTFDGIDHIDLWYNNPGNPAGNAKVIARSAGGRLSLKGAGATATLSGATGTYNQQKYGTEGITNAQRGCLIENCNLIGNATGASG